jgi:hypothetical protein
MTARSCGSLLASLALLALLAPLVLPAAAEPPVAAADTVQIFDPRAAEQPAYEQEYREAGFGVFWPAGCGEINQRVSNGPTERAAGEWFYTCNPDGDRRRGASVLRLQVARTPQNGPPHPRFVVDLVKQHLAMFSVRIVRQRPLEQDGMQGVDVHASEPAGAGEVWVRGLLVGTDVFVLMAWNRAGHVFDDPEIQRFITSLRLF